jgi:tetrahydromethanopterin S-methyltransferase subunit G
MCQDFIKKVELCKYTNAVMHGFVAIEREFNHTRNRLDETDRQLRRLTCALEDSALKSRRQQNQIGFLLGVLTGAVLWIMALFIFVMASH